MIYGPDILINIFHDAKKRKRYLMNVTSKKIYSCPVDLKNKRRKSRKRGVIEIVICILLFIVPLCSDPWYINNPSRRLIVIAMQ